MDVREITGYEELSDRYASAWRRLTVASERATVFQSWEWNAAWWSHYGKRRRLVALLFENDGQTIGIGAFTLTEAPLRILRFVGTGGSDYLDLIAQPGSEAAVALALGEWLGQNRRRWDWADLQQARPDAIAGQVPGATLWAGETCPYLPLPSDWETFRRGLSKKLRQNIGYYERALEKQYAVEMRLATSGTLESDLNTFFELHQRRWNSRWMPGAFASRKARTFHADAARSLLAAGMLRLHTLSLDGIPQASLYCFQKDARRYYYLGGFEPTLAKLSLGTILTAKAIRHAIEADGALEFDFLRGDESYKYRWGACDRLNARLSITRPGLRSSLLAMAGRGAMRAEHRLKTWMHAHYGGAGGGHG